MLDMDRIISELVSFSELTPMNSAAFAVATLTALMSLYLYFIQPSMIIQAYFRVAVRWSGMRVKYVENPENSVRYFYGEKGQLVKGQSTILFLHGFSADHFMWAPIVQHISPSIHVVAIDLPGHGFSSDLAENESIGFKSQVRHIRKFVQLLGLDDQPVHIVGVSMGGALGGLFAAEYPELVSSVTLTCPSMKTPKESRIILENKTRVLADGGELTLDNCPILPQTAQRLQEMLNICHYYNVNYPRQILKGALDLRVRKNEFFLRLLKEITGPESQVILEENCSKVSCPSQVVWGREDWVVDPSGADVLKEKLVNFKSLNIIPECGHAINLDQPAVFARTVLDFWEQHKNVSDIH